MNPIRPNNDDERLNPDQIVLTPLAAYEVDVPEDLEDRILSTLRLQKHTVETLLQEYTPVAPSRHRIIFNRFVDFMATAAAVVLITSAVLLSTNYSRQQARKVLCQGQLGALGQGILSYANDYYNQLPVANVASNSPWYDSSQKQPRRAHLYLLVKGGYSTPELLVCPEDGSKPFKIKNLTALDDFPAGSVVSYSFQNVNGDRHFKPGELQLRWQQAQNMPVMADRTPLLVKDQLNPELKTGRDVSVNHGMKGQNILILDGRVTWQRTAMFGPQQDNIWQAGQIRKYSGQEMPVSATDSFLAP